MAAFELRLGTDVHLDEPHVSDADLNVRDHPRVLIGEGSYGAVRTGTLADGSMIVAKFSTYLAGRNAPLGPEERAAMRDHFNREGATIQQASGARGIIAFCGLVMHPDPAEARTLYIITERMPESLDNALHTRRWRPSLTEIETMMCDIAFGLRRLHALLPPVTHRDFSSKNILVDTTTCRAVISDFGQAKALRGRTEAPAQGHGRPSQTRDTLQPGAPPYCAPESLIEGAEVTERMDIFSLGVLLLEMLCGERPNPSSFNAVVDGVITLVPEVRRRSRHLDLLRNDFLKRVVMACLANDAARRPSARLIAAVFETLCGELAVDAGRGEAALSAGDAQVDLLEIAILLRQDRDRAAAAHRDEVVRERERAAEGAAREVERLMEASFRENARLEDTVARLRDELAAAEQRSTQLAAENSELAATNMTLLEAVQNTPPVAAQPVQPAPRPAPPAGPKSLPRSASAAPADPRAAQVRVNLMRILQACVDGGHSAVGHPELNALLNEELQGYGGIRGFVDEVRGARRVNAVEGVVTALLQNARVLALLTQYDLVAVSYAV